MALKGNERLGSHCRPLRELKPYPPVRAEELHIGKMILPGYRAPMNSGSVARDSIWFRSRVHSPSGLTT